MAGFKKAAIMQCLVLKCMVTLNAILIVDIYTSLTACIIRLVTAFYVHDNYEFNYNDSWSKRNLNT